MIQQLDPYIRPEARQKMITYDSFVFVDVLEYVLRDAEEILVNKHLRVQIAKIPIMLRSSTCNLYNCTPQERMNLEKVLKNPGGWILITQWK